MRLKFFSVFVVTLAAVMIMVLGVAPIEASQYLGEVTWTGQDSFGSFTVKAAISRVGGAYYEVQGQVQAEGSIIIFSGGGVVVGSNLILTVTQTMTDPAADRQEAAVMQISVDKYSNNGTFWALKPIYYIPAQLPSHLTQPLPLIYPAGASLESLTERSQGEGVQKGTLTVSGNPIILATSNEGATMLLLND
jgi:filamentous hemagglutinin family protein